MNYLYPLLEGKWELITYIKGKPDKEFIGSPNTLYYKNSTVQLLGRTVEYKSGKIHFFALCAYCEDEIVFPNKNISLLALDSFMNTLARVGTILPKTMVKKRKIIAEKIYALGPYADLLPNLTVKLKTEWAETVKPHYKNRLTEFYSQNCFTPEQLKFALKRFKSLDFEVTGLILCKFEKIPQYFLIDERLETVKRM